MGLNANILLSNPKNPALLSIPTTALADTGALHLCIPEHLALQLSLEVLEQREVVVADGSKKVVPYVGPVQISFENRNCFTGALVLGDEVLLGVIPMEDMDLVLVPSLRKVAVNPDNPNLAVSVVK
ncbi:MAG TPA: clan AA aspartic protease [Microscillaceae bacterium]|jgi:clan AA aspartic protease|nr:clan AA aspartic protease [Microscillaceae bacterium]